MRKLNATLLNGTSKEEAILKIKDDSFAITTNDQLIKISYSNIKSYNFDEQKEVLSIVKFGGNPIELNIAKDKQLFELLNNVVKQNNSKENISSYENTSLKEKEIKIEKNTIKDIDNQKTDNKQIEKTDIKENLIQNTSNENSDNASGNNIFKTISAIISVIVLVIIVFNFFGGGNIEGGYKAEQYALQEIPESVLTLAFEPAVTSNELKCEAKEKTDDEIILVKCTTTNEHIIDYYESETIWYAYQETADGIYHYHSINKSKDKVLEKIRNK